MSSSKKAAEPDEFQISQQYWDERTGEIQHSRRSWQIASAALFLALCAALWGIIHIGSLAKTTVIPVLVNPDTGQTQVVRTSGQSKLSADDWKKVKQEAFRNLITSWRTVTTDDKFRRLNWDNTFSWIQGQSKAEADAHNWFVAHNPDKRCLEETVSVDIDPGSPVTDNTFEVWWTESVYKGGQVQTHRMQGLFTYRMTGQPVAKNNGFGLLVTDFTLPRGDYL